jgi:hypothetical protein
LAGSGAATFAFSGTVTGRGTGMGGELASAIAGSATDKRTADMNLMVGSYLASPCTINSPFATGPAATPI